jgi:uncharacterized cupin superfamily protein
LAAISWKMNAEARPIFLAPVEGDTLHAFGEEVILHLSGAQTGGKFALWTEVTPAGGRPPPHYHLNEDELFLVQEGKIGFLVDN